MANGLTITLRIEANCLPYIISTACIIRLKRAVIWRLVSATFSYPITFVCFRSRPYLDLFERPDEVPSPAEFGVRRASNEECWSVLTYIQLKRRGFNVAISDRFIPGSICVASTLDYGLRQRPFGAFRSRLSRRRPRGRDCVTSQSSKTEQILIQRQRFTSPYGRIRASFHDRKKEALAWSPSSTRVLVLTFTRRFVPTSSKISWRLLVFCFNMALGHADQPPSDGHDYATADLVLAVRDLTEKDALVKPASKLINARLAQEFPRSSVPSQRSEDLRQSELDYIEIRTPQDVLDVISRLKLQPSLYEQMVSNAVRRSLGIHRGSHSQTLGRRIVRANHRGVSPLA